MSTLKTALRVGGILVALIGGLCLPVPNYVFDKGDFSAFHNLADLGAFAQIGLALIVVGLLAFGLSFAVPAEMSR